MPAGIHTPPTSVLNGADLPSARLVSIVMFPDLPVNDQLWTLVTMSWGQIITHDMSMAVGTAQASKCDEKAFNSSTRSTSESVVTLNLFFRRRASLYPMLRRRRPSLLQRRQQSALFPHHHSGGRSCIRPVQTHVHELRPFDDGYRDRMQSGNPARRTGRNYASSFTRPKLLLLLSSAYI